MSGHPILAPVYELADGDKSFSDDLLQSMAAAIPADIAEIEKAIEKKHITLMCRSAHHMKSSIMYSNATDLKDLLITIEHKEETHTAIDEVKALLPKLKELAKALLDVVNTELAK
jgi:hypothetical protein